jgi:hypothetical protein
VSKALQIAQDMYGLRKYGGASLKEASHCCFTNDYYCLQLAAVMRNSSDRNNGGAAAATVLCI